MLDCVRSQGHGADEEAGKLCCLAVRGCRADDGGFDHGEDVRVAADAQPGGAGVLWGEVSVKSDAGVFDVLVDLAEELASGHGGVRDREVGARVPACRFAVLSSFEDLSPVAAHSRVVGVEFCEDFERGAGDMMGAPWGCGGGLAADAVCDGFRVEADRLGLGEEAFEWADVGVVLAEPVDQQVEERGLAGVLSRVPREDGVVFA